MVLIQLLLPTRMATGTPQNGATAMENTRRELVAMFEGLTAYLRSPASGTWTAPDGHSSHDEVVMVEVVTERFDREWWRSYARTLADRFGQDTVHVRAMPIELLDEAAR